MRRHRSIFEFIEEDSLVCSRNGDTSLEIRCSGCWLKRFSECECEFELGSEFKSASSASKVSKLVPRHTPSTGSCELPSGSKKSAESVNSQRNTTL